MKLRLFKTKSCPELDPHTLALLVKFLTFVIQQLNLKEHEVKIRLLGANPTERITTGAYSPEDKKISTIIAGRHPIDWFRTIAHELTHMKQDVLEGKVETKNQEIGGPLENEANAQAGIFVKYFIKNILTPDDKQRLGLGNF